MMKLAVIMGSPKGMKGYTGMLIQPMLDAIEEAGAEVKIYSLGKLKVNFCKACTEKDSAQAATLLHDGHLLPLPSSPNQSGFPRTDRHQDNSTGSSRD